MLISMGGTNGSLNWCRELAGSTHGTPGYLADTEHTHTHTHTHPVILGHGNATVRSLCVYSVWLPIWMCPSHGTVNGFPFPRAGQYDQTLSRSCQEGRRYQEEWNKSWALHPRQGLRLPRFIQELKKTDLPQEIWTAILESLSTFWRGCCGLLLLALFYVLIHNVRVLAEIAWQLLKMENAWNSWLYEHSGSTLILNCQQE